MTDSYFNSLLIQETFCAFRNCQTDVKTHWFWRLVNSFRGQQIEYKVGRHVATTADVSVRSIALSECHIAHLCYQSSSRRFIDAIANDLLTAVTTLIPWLSRTKLFKSAWTLNHVIIIIIVVNSCNSCTCRHQMLFLLLLGMLFITKKWLKIVGLCCEIVQAIQYRNNSQMSALFWIILFSKVIERRRNKFVNSYNNVSLL